MKKNKILAFICITLVTLSISACGGNEKPVEQSVQQKVEETDSQETAANEGIDKDLEGIDLVHSIAYKKPEKLMIKSEMTASGLTTKMTTYYDGDKTRTEVESPNLPQSVLISLPSEGVMYTYVSGQSDGFKMVGADNTYAEEMGLMVDDSELLTEIVDESSDDIIARVETLDGEEVIYIETSEADEEMGNVLVKMWYSNKYGTPLKYEVIMNETTMMELKVTEINDKEKIDDSLFVPPSDVNFQEVNMEQMVENW
ncbi:hypothetical protein [Anaerotignum sp.]|uniref:hypothetical protein n=1 Tax=Anaerotignum sp. TaxID=2039241 RepID=UPI0027149577|nr:hypothetical protein [Anaerotignum sp.]